MAWSCPSFSRPSTVVISVPSVWTANMVHDFTAAPFINTVHAPQYVVSQPTCVPVRSSSSRNNSTSSMRGSTVTEIGFPFTFNLIGTFPMISGIDVADLDLLTAGASDSEVDRTLHQRPDQSALIVC